MNHPCVIKGLLSVGERHLILWITVMLSSSTVSHISLHIVTFFILQKENEHMNDQRERGQSESKGPKQDCTPTKLHTFGFSDKVSSSLPEKSNQDHLAENVFHMNKLESMSTAQLEVPSSVKRTFSDVERSPETPEFRAKKKNTDYKRFCEIPEETKKFHTGLTGTFSTIKIGDSVASAGRMVAAEDRVPKRSSPIDVAKSLFCELDDPVEDVFEDGARDLSHTSFTSPIAGTSDICRNLSMDSDGSIQETSFTTESHASLQPTEPSKNRNSSSLDEEMGSKDSFYTASLTQTPVFTEETPKLGHFLGRDESHSSYVSRLPNLSCSDAQPPLFLKPRNVVAFRSYCSSINRSNVSRLSVGSVEAMDLSTATSCHPASEVSTPVQKRPSSSGSLYQVNTPDSLSSLHGPSKATHRSHL